MASSFLYISSFALPLLLLLLLSCFSLIPLPVVSGTGSNETDRLALLQVKSTLRNQTLHFCQWQGVFCNEQRVTQLDLKLNRLSGTISPYIGNLTFLTHLILNNNTISGEIPPDIGRLHSLQELVLVQNSLTGTIPANISACSNLTSLRIGYNGLMGEIPLELCKLMKLQLLSIHFNNLTGNFPSCFGNVSSLEAISAPRNGFVGGIPESLARLRNLKIMSFGSNRFSGVFPPQFFNSSSIQVISLAVNNFSGQIPDSISNATNLQVLELGQNNFHGKVPSLAKLNRLQLLGLINNSLGSDGQDGDDLMFLHSLTNSTLLEVVNVGMNNFAGNLPHSISNYSTTFVRLSLRISRVFGTLPPGLDRLVNLEQLDFNDNRLSGHLPIELGKIPKLMTLQGSIPSSFGSCKGMTLLYLASNNLSGSIPPEILNLPDLSITLNLSRNSLSGQIPDEVGNLINLGRLDLSNNFLTGRIPANLGRCVRLETLNLMGNMFQGSIPSSLRALRGLVVLDLSRNNLSGEVPVFLQEFTSLVRLNLSYNNLEGALLKQGIFGNATVTMVMGNSELCGGMPEFGLPKCPVQGSKKGGLNTVVCGLLGLISLLSFIYLCFLKKKIKDPEASKFTGNALLEATYHHLLKATDGFSSANLLGVGSFGSVYQGLIVIDDSSTKMVAVKVLNLQNARASKSFVAECEVLKNIRHRNLVKLLTVCSGIDYHGNEFKALVYDFMVNGSLEEWLHIQVIPEEASTRKLTLLQRLNIAIDVGSGLDYLHNNSGIPVVHCDLKPSNILLDVNMVGHIGDFGLAKFLPEVAAGPPTTDIANSSIGVRGTVGYSAPEYGMGSEVSRSGDVYSYGILLLEMFTGRRPTDEMFRDGLNLHNFIAEGLPDKAAEIMDPVLLMEMQENSRFITSNQGWRPDQQVLAEALVSIVQVGVDCSNETPRERMSISDASASLTAVRDKFISGRTNERHTAIEGAASPASS
ncbi:Probable LRR receptor-like serine/threonine-protein kinase At3g47570 [Linum perenne]